MPKMNEAQWQAFLKGEMKPYWVDNAAGKGQIPLFGSEDNPFDIITPSFAFLTRYEEFFAKNADAYGRFPYQGSLAQKYDLVEIPIVDEYAMILRRNLCTCSPETFTPIPRKPKIVPTHDIDLLCRFETPFQSLKSIFGRDLLINRDLTMVRKSLEGYRAWKKDFYKDPYIQAIIGFAQKEHAVGMQPLFFFKSLYEGDEDVTYDIRDVRLLQIWKEVMKNGGVIGLHGSLKSAEEIGRLRMERQRLEKELGSFTEDVTVVRQHYLRAHFVGTPNSLDFWQESGTCDDYTLGFAERCGFRCGTCHPYPLYDVRNDRVTDIIEHPLIVMDGTLFDYMKLSVDEAKDLALKLKQRCLDVEGDFVFLWHNHTTTREFERYYEEVYMSLVSS